MRYFALILTMAITTNAGETRLEKIARVMTATKDTDAKIRCATMMRNEARREQMATKAEIAIIKREIELLNNELVAAK